MQSSDDKSLIPIPIASEAASGNVATIPLTQATAGDGRVCLELGYPPECAISVAAGGKFPEMQDANGVYNLLSSAIKSIQAWGILPFNSDFATAIGGYPQYALVSDSSGNYWISTADNNTTVPGADGSNWQSLFYGYDTRTVADGRYLLLSTTAAQTVTGQVTFSGATGFNLKIANAPASPILGIGGDAVNTYWVDTYYARITALNSEAQVRAAADALKANLAGGNTFSGSQTFSNQVTFSGSPGFNVKITNAPAAPTTGTGGDATNTYWVDTYYARKSSVSTFLSVLSSSSVSAPSWANRVEIIAVGGGGGGSSCKASGSTPTSTTLSGGGGGSGQYVRGVFSVASGNTVGFTIGSGGSSESSGGTTSASVAGTTVISAGGGALSHFASAGVSAGGAGGTGGFGGNILTVSGNDGGDGQNGNITTTGGMGGAGPWGGAGRGGALGGISANGYGAGGGGAYDGTYSNNTYAGGAGYQGVILYRFLP